MTKLKLGPIVDDRPVKVMVKSFGASKPSSGPFLRNPRDHALETIRNSFRPSRAHSFTKSRGARSFKTRVS